MSGDRFDELIRRFPSWIQVIDQSDFSIGEWSEAWERLHQLMDQDKKTADSEICFGYLSCCSDHLKSLQNPPRLVDQLELMYTQHGFAGAKLSDPQKNHVE